jgi:hypothetical protein
MDPFAMVAENKNWFGGPLMPERNRSEIVPTPDSQRYFKSVLKPAKWVAQFINDVTGGDDVESGLVDVSPETLELVVDQVGGSAFRFAKDIALLPTRGEDLRVHHVPFLRRIMAQKSEYIDSKRYYKAREEVEIAKEKAEVYPARERSDLLRLSTALKASERQLRKYRKIKKRFEVLAEDPKLKAIYKEKIKRIEANEKAIQNLFYQKYKKLVNE